MPELIEAAADVIRSGRYINGENLRKFEKNMEDYFHVPFCIGVSTGLDALRLILTAYKELGLLHEGDEVIVPANTFIATFLAVTHCGLKAVAADVDESNFCLDFKRLPISPATKAIIPVHLYGRVCWDEAVMRSLHDRGILVIEDAAQSVGARNPYPGFNGSEMAGALGDAAAISFYPAKNIGALGDAGAVLTADPQLAAAVRQLANYGSDVKYHHSLCGFNCRMDEMQAALLNVKLPLAEEVALQRRRRARLYSERITNPEVILPQMPACEESHVWHQFVIRHPKRDLLRRFLEEEGIGTEIHYPVACHRQPCYEGHPLLLTPAPLPVAERLASEVLSLPIADATDGQIDFISNAINKFLHGNRH